MRRVEIARLDTLESVESTLAEVPMAWHKKVTKTLTESWDKAVDFTVDAGKEVGDAAGTAWRATGDARKATSNHVGKAARATADSAKWVGQKTADQVGALGAFLAQGEILKWSEAITRAPATIYDKAMDSEYLRTHIGGGDHRMFDGGHTLSGAWERVRDASDTDSFTQEVIGYVTGIWKDVTTPKGLPFITWEKQDYDRWTEWAANHVPGVDKEFLYDLLSFDAFEVLSTGLGAVGVVFALKAEDKEKLAEILGAMGIISILSANPIMGLAVIATTAYAYFVKKHEVDGKALFKGGVVAGTSMAVFAILGLPLLVELIIAMVLAALLKKYVLSRDDLVEMMMLRGKELGLSAVDVTRRVTGEIAALVR